MSEASQAYQNRKNEVNRLLDLIVTEGIPAFDDQQACDPNNWGYAGTMAHIVENLVNIAFALDKITSEEAQALTGIEY